MCCHGFQRNGAIRYDQLPIQPLSNGSALRNGEETSRHRAIEKGKALVCNGFCFGRLHFVAACFVVFPFVARRKAKQENGELGERVRLARDLHDRLGGLLTAVKQHLSVADDKASELTDEAMREMCNVAHHLLPDALQRCGLRTALHDYCKTMKNVSFAFYGNDKHVANEELVYCIVYELVNNAVKNANANHITVQLIVNDGNTIINVSDDGSGMPDVSQSESYGLIGIHERVKAIGGTMTIYSKPNEGTEINIEIKKGGKRSM